MQLDALPAATRPKCLVVPVRFRRYVPELDCMVQRVIGYRAACSCGTRLSVHRHRSAAHEDKKEHEATHAGATA